MKIIPVITLIVLFAVFTMCNNSKQTPPERLAAIPKEAEWQGGADGGAWFIVNQGDSINTFKVKIYNESDGSLRADEIFRLSNNCSDTVLNVEEVRKLISFYDGEIIGLVNIRKEKYCSLIPVKK